MTVAPAAGARARTTVEVVWCPDGERAVDLVLTFAPAATVGDLLTSLGGVGDRVYIDGAAVTANTPLAECGLQRGARLCAGAEADVPRAAPVASVSVIGGVLTGQHHELPAGTWTLGRSALTDVNLDSPTVSGEHAVLRVAADGAVEIEDCSSTNGTWVDGVHASQPTAVGPDALVQVGALLLAIRPTSWADAARASLGATGTFNRPPRHLPVRARARLELPAARADDGPTARLSWIAMLAPLALGAVMALFYDPRFALFALFSPLMMFGTWLDDRRRGRRSRRSEDRRLEEELDRLREDIAAARREHAIAARRSHPGPAEAMRRAWRRTPALWERREDHPDFLDVVVGFGTVDWEPEVTTPSRGAAKECAEVLDSSRRVGDMPVTTCLLPGSGFGIAGKRDNALALARGLLLQVAGFSGPADVRIAVVCDPDRVGAWEWVKWLPHSRDPFGAASQVLIAATEEGHELVAAAAAETVGATTVFVVDGDALLASRDAPVRRVLAGGHASAIVCAPTADALPSVCTTVVTVADDDGLAVMTDDAGSTSEDILLCAVAEERARTTALSLAPVSDPEAIDGGASLPDHVAMTTVLGIEVSAETLLQRWRSGGEPVASVGLSAEGPLLIDLEADGPHGLIAGTTGSGKSELLRTIVVGLAANASPEDLTFVLIDYKGGSAFDACARLPHTVGMVTDLDQHLGRRALCCLEAELRHRERALREAGAPDLAAYRRIARDRDLPPLPRLVIAVDEFATLVAELPDFVDRLVAVAQRGRSLGLHLLLATQRPSGAVSDQIRANTNLRIALRVQDAADSSDVIADPAAARLSRRVPGRGYMRLGHGELVAFQTATSSAAPATELPPVTVEPFVPTSAGDSNAVATGEHTELSLIVSAAAEAFAASGIAPPRRPWPQPLPAALTFEALKDLGVAGGGRYAIGIADDPQNQQQLPHVFDPSRGGLLLYGATLASGPTAAVATIVTAAASDPDIDCYVIDAGAQTLAGLEALPGVGVVVRGGHRRGQERLVQYLSEELERRRAATAGGDAASDRTMLVVVDNYAGFAATFDDLDGLGVLDAFMRIAAEGPAFGIVPVITADRVNAVPPAIASTIGRRLLFRLADAHDYGQFGVPAPAADDMPDLRAIDVASGLHVQIGTPPASPADTVTPGVRPPAAAAPVDDLPAVVDLPAIIDEANFDGAEWRLPLGLDDRALRPAGWRLGPGDHALITGPARSGKSSALATIAAIAAKVAEGLEIHAVALRRSPLRNSPHVGRVAASPAEFEALVRAIADQCRPALLLIDDADMTEDMSGLLTELLAERRDDLWCIAAGRADVLRSQYGHWTAEVRRSRHGLALRPNLDLDGDLWHTALPRRCRDQMLPGRGFLVTEGTAELLQVARP